MENSDDMIDNKLSVIDEDGEESQFYEEFDEERDAVDTLEEGKATSKRSKKRKDPKRKSSKA